MPRIGVSARLSQELPTKRMRDRPKKICGSGSAPSGAMIVSRMVCTWCRFSVPTWMVSWWNGMRYSRQPAAPSGLPALSFTETMPPSRT